MKKSYLIFCLLAFLGVSCAKESPLTPVAIVTESVVFPEAVIGYNGAVLSTNFGITEFNPLNNEGKGYITSYKDGKNTVLIAADSNLNAPKGMTIKNDRLFVSDVNKIVVYNLAALDQAPQTMLLPDGEQMVNDVAFKGNDLYATSTITGNIFKFADVQLGDSLSYVAPVVYTNVVGANGILIVEDVMYIASFDPNSQPKPENGIYAVDMASEALEAKMITKKPGLYDGVVITDDGKTLYYSNWADKEIGKIDLASGSITSALLTEENTPASAGDIAIVDGVLVVPDLLANRLIVLPLF